MKNTKKKIQNKKYRKIYSTFDNELSLLVLIGHWFNEAGYFYKI